MDYKRLCKQRVEARQILNVLYSNNKNIPWTNHPAVLMWEGYEECLKYYYNCCVEDWIFRGYKNTMERYEIDVSKLLYPPFIGNKKFHSSHRSNLLRKNKEYYSQFGWTEPDNLEYVWPVRIK